MYLKQLELNNFQKHSHLILDFTPDTNVIYGASDVGKSCIRRALEWVLYNKSLRNDGIRKEDTKKTSVKVTLDNEVIVERIKSNSINRYVLTIGKEVKEFNAIGKEIPEEVKQALQVRTVEVDKEELILNIAEQIALPFLLDKSGTYRMKLFNQLTGSDVLDDVFSSLNKDILHIGKVEKIEKENLIEQENKLEEVTKEKKIVKEKYDKYNNKYQELKELIDKHSKLNKTVEQLNNINTQLKETNNKINNIKIIDKDKLIQLNNQINKLNIYNDINNNITLIDKEINNNKEQLKQIKLPKIDIVILKNKINKLEQLIKIDKKLKDVNQNIGKTKFNIQNCQVMINNYEKSYKEILKEIKICPFYKKECPLNKEIKNDK